LAYYIWPWKYREKKEKEKVTFVKSISPRERVIRIFSSQRFPPEKLAIFNLVRIDIDFIANQHVSPSRFVAPDRAPVGTTSRTTDW
jgi:hypothetical protein